MAQEVAEDARQRLDKTRSTAVHSGPVVAYASEDGADPPLPSVPPVSPLLPLGSQAVSGRAAANRMRLQTVQRAVATGNLVVMIPILAPIAKRLGLDIDYETPDGVQLLQDALHAYAGTREVAVQRDEGKVAGINDTLIDKVIGHESGTVQARYSHAEATERARAISALDWGFLGFR